MLSSRNADPPREFDLWMMAALGCLPFTLIVLFAPFVPVTPRVAAWLFVAGMGIQWWRGEYSVLAIGAKSGAWLMPAGIVVGAFAQQVLDKFGGSMFDGGFVVGLIGCAFFGCAAGIITAEQYEAISVLGSHLSRGRRGEVGRGDPLQSSSEFLDEHTFPLEAPPVFGLPRQFGVRGLLIVTTWAAVLLSYLRMRGVQASAYFTVLTFVGGTLAAQVLLFRGQKPIKASAWAGAMLLPVLTLAVSCIWPSHSSFARLEQTIFECAMQCAFSVSVGIVLGAVVGTVAGAIYSGTEELVARFFGGVPSLALAPIADADADVLLSWVSGPKLCHRWASDHLKWPLDNGQLLQRFAAARSEHPVRFIFKAVSVSSGEMIGYAELSALEAAPNCGAVKLALIDPNRSERGRLTVRLFRVIASHAFGVLGMTSITMITPADQPELARLPLVYYKEES